MGVYLDNAATTRIDDKVLAAMTDLMRESWGNPSAVHGMGLAARGEIEKARSMIGACLSVDPARIVFTSGATEANNTALNHYAAEGERKGNRHMVVSAIEHHSIIEYCCYLEKRGFEVSIVNPRSNGTVYVSDVEKEIRKDTCLVCLMGVNNETGMIQPYEPLAMLCRERAIPYHCDATQAVGHIPFGTFLENASFSFSAHKFHGPKGVGCLVLPSELSQFNKLLHGGAQEGYRRAGTESVEGIVGMAVALAESKREGLHTSDIKWMKKRLWSGLQHKVGGVVLNGTLNGSISYILNVSFEGVQSDALVSMLSNVYEVYCSTGSACCSGTTEPNRVLKSMGLSDAQALGSVRFSFSRYNTLEEIDYTIQSISNAVSVLR